MEVMEVTAEAVVTSRREMKPSTRQASRLFGLPRAALIASAVAALPAAYAGLLLLNPVLPLMPWERSAIVKAEQFVKRHGFTQLGHPADQPVLSTDVMDHLLTPEQLRDNRRDSLREHASGIASVGFGHRLVLFEPLRAGEQANPYRYRQVEVHGGRVHMPHQQYLVPGWMVKRVNR